MIHRNLLLTFLQELVNNVENDRLSEREMIKLGDAIRYYYYDDDKSDIKYFTLGYYIYNFLLKNNN